jgi:hypothetical protein
MTFKEKLELALRGTNIENGDLCRVLGVSRPTVQRWRNGVNEPHPAMWASVFKAISRLRGDD